MTELPEHLALSREATDAGLIVAELRLMSFRRGAAREYAITLWTSDAELWADAVGVSAEVVRAHISRYVGYRRRSGVWGVSLAWAAVAVAAAAAVSAVVGVVM